MDTQYRIEWIEEMRQWMVRHAERGTAGEVVMGSGSFVSQVPAPDRSALPLQVGESKTLKAAVEQVIWYDRAMNQECE